jgi:hypothetical protein
LVRLSVAILLGLDTGNATGLLLWTMIGCNVVSRIMGDASGAMTGSDIGISLDVGRGLLVVESRLGLPSNTGFGKMTTDDVGSVVAPGVKQHCKKTFLIVGQHDPVRPRAAQAGLAEQVASPSNTFGDPGTSLGVELGTLLGKSLGSLLGPVLGITLGVSLGCLLGPVLGIVLGVSLGSLLGAKLGIVLGVSLGRLLGPVLGIAIGVSLGIPDGLILGVKLGVPLGLSEGNEIGRLLGVVLGVSLGWRLGITIGEVFGV